ncbi:serine hydrolase domain-containing protein [Nocardia shimofusensis]|uniref:serine hydrolase domain-containing protein n=1 Tax=Nocardia shimofusensis TaxID=228596 RepID=UPI0008373341|nr:serine hydrolase [Nocardia shimofusensis]
MGRRWPAAVATMALVVGTAVMSGAVSGAAQAQPLAHCAVDSGREPQRATPEAAGFDAEGLDAALRFAAGRNRFNVQIFRNNCLIGEGPNNTETGRVPWNVWSSTKSVVSLLAGMAIDRGALDLHAPIDRYLPAGLGDAAHRAITVHNLLTETSGMKAAVVTEGITGAVPIDPNSAVQALGVPLVNAPGTVFSYSQRNVDLLAYVIELALGEPLQQFAQRELFDPLGIERGDYYWAKDRSGNTYGYAHLMIPPDDFAELGLLIAADGRWGDRQIVSADYLREARSPSRANPCYGYLFWTGNGCAEIPNFLPSDTYSTSGLGLQNIFVVPSLDLVVMWTGVFGNVSRYGAQGVLQNFGELSHEFFRMLAAAMPGRPLGDPAPYQEPPLRTDPGRYVDTDLLIAVFGLGPAAYPGCNVFSCLHYRLAAPFADAPPGCFLLACLGTDPRTPGIR